MAEISRYKVEQEENWREWIYKIPAIKFNSDWEVRIIPPFGGAFARFMIDFNNRHVSVYLDCNDSLGFMQEPYWEVHPVYGDVGRCLLNEVDELLNLINESLTEFRPEDKYSED